MKLVAWNTLLTAILGLAVLGRRINAYCRKSALPCVDLLEPLRASGMQDGSPAVNAIDSHPNAEYNRFIAAQLAPTEFQK